ncbi:MAG: hypothetical protein BSR46_00980 [Candidatus Dactylopiibacterium carminicum]|nr:MAG: hypothetical protein BSR46_00980 [Candidatus Dactylopiibacterium carminicum]
MAPPVSASTLQIVAKALLPVQAGRRLSLHEKDLRVMKEVRCANCNRKLAEADYSALNIKCPRCGVMNQLSNRLGRQALCIVESHIEPCFAMALSIVSSLRMQATRATFLRLPAASRRS